MGRAVNHERKTLRHHRFRGYGLRWKTALSLPSEPWQLFGVEMGGCSSVKENLKPSDTPLVQRLMAFRCWLPMPRNSYGRCALPLPMHSTSSACRE